MIDYAKFCLMHLSSNERYALKTKKHPNKAALYGLSLTRINTTFRLGVVDYHLIIDLKNNTIQSRKRVGMSKWGKCSGSDYTPLFYHIAKQSIERAYTTPDLESSYVLWLYTDQGIERLHK